MRINKTALIVDDDRNVLESLERNVSDREYGVTAASSFEEAKRYSDKIFDLSIIDSLGGKCFELYDIINAKRKFIYTGDWRIEKEAEKRNKECYPKCKSLSDILK